MNKILLVEDDAVQIEILRRHLESRGYQLVIARNGTDAIRLARQEQPSLILMDMILPGMHGLEASIILKGKPETAKIPIVALTVMSSPKFIDECYKVGISAFIRKPADPQSIQDSIVKVIGKLKRPPLILAAAGGSDALTGITTTLRTLEYRVFVAGDTAQAVSRAKSMKPDMIIVDMTAPVEEYTLLLEKLRKSGEIRKIPMALLGKATDLDELKLKAVACGALDVLTYPISLDAVVRKIRRILKED